MLAERELSRSTELIEGDYFHEVVVLFELFQDLGAGDFLKSDGHSLKLNSPLGFPSFSAVPFKHSRQMMRARTDPGPAKSGGRPPTVVQARCRSLGSAPI